MNQMQIDNTVWRCPDRNYYRRKAFFRFWDPIKFWLRIIASLVFFAFLVGAAVFVFSVGGQR